MWLPNTQSKLANSRYLAVNPEHLRKFLCGLGRGYAIDSATVEALLRAERAVPKAMPTRADTAGRESL